jgi:hypothetical protein
MREMRCYLALFPQLNTRIRALAISISRDKVALALTVMSQIQESPFGCFRWRDQTESRAMITSGLRLKSNPEAVLTSAQWRRPARTVASAATLSLVLALFGACSSGSSPSTAPAKSHASASTTPSAFLKKSGTGNEALPAVLISAKWTVTWKFNCQHPVRKASFALSAIKQGAAPLAVTNQTGLGGGGQMPFKDGGTYSFDVKTSCSWNVDVAATPLPTPPVTTKPAPARSASSTP